MCFSVVPGLFPAVAFFQWSDLGFRLDFQVTDDLLKIKNRVKTTWPSDFCEFATEAMEHGILRSANYSACVLQIRAKHSSICIGGSILTDAGVWRLRLILIFEILNNLIRTDTLIVFT